MNFHLLIPVARVIETFEFIVSVYCIKKIPKVTVPLKNIENYCQACLMPLASCICQVMPLTVTDTRVTVVVHYSDSARLSNSGKWVPLVLENSEVMVRGLINATLDAKQCIQPGYHNLVLFPDKDSIPLTEDYCRNLDKPVNLIVPDGNWNQAGKMNRRETSLAHLPRVHIPLGKPTRYRLRKAAHENWISTFEAVARALGFLESKELQRQLEVFFDTAVDRILYLKGRKLSE